MGKEERTHGVKGLALADEASGLSSGREGGVEVDLGLSDGSVTESGAEGLDVVHLVGGDLDSVLTDGVAGEVDLVASAASDVSCDSKRVRKSALVGDVAAVAGTAEEILGELGAVGGDVVVLSLD